MQRAQIIALIKIDPGDVSGEGTYRLPIEDQLGGVERSMGKCHAVIPVGALPQYTAEGCADLYQNLGNAFNLFGERTRTGLFLLYRLVAPLSDIQNVISIQQQFIIAAPFLEAAFLSKKIHVVLCSLQFGLFNEFSVVDKLRADEPAGKRQDAEIIVVMLMLDQRQLQEFADRVLKVIVVFNATDFLESGS